MRSTQSETADRRAAARQVPVRADGERGGGLTASKNPPLTEDQLRQSAEARHTAAQASRNSQLHHMIAEQRQQQAAAALDAIVGSEDDARRGRSRRRPPTDGRLCICATDLGLLSEEYDPAIGRLAGSFPQAFSHLGLSRAADAIAEAQSAP
jgi:hypothetical protein